MYIYIYIYIYIHVHDVYICNVMHVNVCAGVHVQG